MSEFKVGDRVRIREDLKEDEAYEGTWVTEEMLQYVGKIATIKWANDRYYRIDLDDEEYAWVKEFFEKIRTITLEELEQRIEKLEKEVFKPVEIHDRPKETKPSLLTEDEKVILRNVDEDFKWIIRNTHQLTITERKPRLEKHGWTVEGGRLADLPYRKLFKFIKFEDDEPYNIEELLKGECGNE